MDMDDRRKHQRVHSLNLLSYVCFDENNRAVTQGMGKTLNVSEGGILLETHTPLERKHSVSMTMGLKDDTMDIKGKIIHSVTRGDGTIQTGIQFAETDEATRQGLKEFIRAFRDGEK